MENEGEDFKFSWKFFQLFDLRHSQDEINFLIYLLNYLHLHSSYLMSHERKS